MALAVAATVGLAASASEGDRPDNESRMLYAPLVYDSYSADDAAATRPVKENDLYRLDAGDEWLHQAMDNSARTRRVRQRAMIDNPQLVAY